MLESAAVPLVFREAARAYLAHVKEEAERPATARRIAVSFVSLGRAFGEMEVAAIGAAAIERYKSERRRVVAPITLRHDLHALSGFFRYAARMGWCAANPMQGVKLPGGRWNARIHVLTEEEERAYLRAAVNVSRALYVVAKLMLAAGLRPGEALGLKVGDVDQARRAIHVREGKTAASMRTLQLSGATAELAVAVARGRAAAEPVFPGRREGTGMTKLNNSHRKACEACGLRFRLYDLRHTFATRLAEKGVPLPTLAALLGHNGLRCVMIYVHPSQRAMDEALLRWVS